MKEASQNRGATTVFLGGRGGGTVAEVSKVRAGTGSSVIIGSGLYGLRWCGVACMPPPARPTGQRMPHERPRPSSTNPRPGRASDAASIASHADMVYPWTIGQWDGFLGRFSGGVIDKGQTGPDLCRVGRGLATCMAWSHVKFTVVPQGQGTKHTAVMYTWLQGCIQ